MEKSVQEIIAKSSSVCLCPFYNIKYEYRVVVLDGVVKLIYKKAPIELVGDGVRTIQELLIELMQNLSPDHLSRFLKNLQDSKYTGGKLKKVLEQGERFRTKFQHNLGLGATFTMDIDDETKEKVAIVATNAVKALQATFVTADVAEIETENGREFRIMEVNSGVMFKVFLSVQEAQDKVTELVEELLERIFE